MAETATTLVGDSVASAQIAEGTIAEVDLDPALQSRLIEAAIVPEENGACPQGFTRRGQVYVPFDGGGWAYFPFCERL